MFNSNYKKQIEELKTRLTETELAKSNYFMKWSYACEKLDLLNISKLSAEKQIEEFKNEISLLTNQVNFNKIIIDTYEKLYGALQDKTKEHP